MKVTRSKAQIGPVYDKRGRASTYPVDVVLVDVSAHCEATIPWPEGSTFGTVCSRNPGHEGPHSAKVESLITWTDTSNPPTVVDV